ncbi:MAG: rod shape-determining protein MreC [bacterium]
MFKNRAPRRIKPVQIYLTLTIGLTVLILSRIPTVRDSLWTAMEPVAAPLRSLSVKINSSLQSSGSLKETQAQNQRLKEALSQLIVDKSVFLRLQTENEELLSLLHYAPGTKSRLLTARIIDNDPSLNRKLIIIDLGENQLVQVGQPVLGSSGALLGTIETTYANHSVVRLLRDPKTRIATKIAGTPDSDGILMPVEGGTLGLKYLSENLKVKADDLVLTSTLNSKIPADIPIGLVHNVFKEPDAPFQRAILDTYSNPGDERFVGVLIQKEPSV